MVTSATAINRCLTVPLKHIVSTTEAVLSQKRAETDIGRRRAVTLRQLHRNLNRLPHERSSGLRNERFQTWWFIFRRAFAGRYWSVRQQVISVR
jgi:hypothetical protein